MCSRVSLPQGSTSRSSSGTRSDGGLVSRLSVLESGHCQGLRPGSGASRRVMRSIMAYLTQASTSSRSTPRWPSHTGCWPTWCAKPGETRGHAGWGPPDRRHRRAARVLTGNPECGRWTSATWSGCSPWSRCANIGWVEVPSGSAVHPAHRGPDSRPGPSTCARDLRKSGQR